jgi:porin
MPRRHNGDVSFYAIIDQPLFGGGPDEFAIFARAMGAPGDRNLVGTYLDSGITYKKPSKNLFDQAGDTIGVAAAYARIGSAARALTLTPPHLRASRPQRSSETALELTYQIQLVPGWQVHPDL